MITALLISLVVVLVIVLVVGRAHAGDFDAVRGRIRGLERAQEDYVKWRKRRDCKHCMCRRWDSLRKYCCRCEFVEDYPDATPAT